MTELHTNLLGRRVKMINVKGEGAVLNVYMFRDAVVADVAFDDEAGTILTEVSMSSLKLMPDLPGPCLEESMR